VTVIGTAICEISGEDLSIYSQTVLLNIDVAFEWSINPLMLFKRSDVSWWKLFI